MVEGKLIVVKCADKVVGGEGECVRRVEEEEERKGERDF